MKKLNKKTIIALSASLAAVLIVACVLIIVFALKGKNDDKCDHTNTSLQNAVSASCATEGYTGDVVCNDCTKIISVGTVLQKLEHTYDDGKITKQATCISQGVFTNTCTACGTTKVSSIETVAHKDEYHDDQAGKHIHTCLSCSLNEKNEHTPTGEGVSFAATCTEDAYTEYVCADCEGIYKVYDTTNKATGHRFSNWQLTEATCMAAGCKSQSCLNLGCTETNTIEIPVSTSCDMVFVGYQNNQAPTCTREATAIYACKDCHAEETVTVEATGAHKYVTIEDNGTGFVFKKCSVCNGSISSFNAKTETVANVDTSKINTSEKLEMDMKEAAIQFPSDVVADITSGSNLSVSADVVDTAKKNDAVNKVQDPAVKQALANAPVFDFTVKVDDQPFTENFSSKVAITMPYTDPVDDAEGLVIFYLAENGNIEEIRGVVYDEENKQITFFVEHFSYYAVAYQETQAMRCKRGNHDYKPTGVTVKATCYQFGYTDYECSGCHKHTVDNIVARAEHKYGDIIPGTPTCENGAWSTRVCQNDGCNSVLNVQFVGATGHTKDGIADCDTPSTCTKCHQILARPLGHNWTAWETIREATEVSTGLRRRYCLNCGEMEENTIATTGTIEAIEFNSYPEFFAVLLEEILNLSNGTLTFSANAYGDEVLATVKVMKKDNGYRLSIVADVDGDKVEFYYDNGVFVAIQGNSFGAASDIENLIPLSIDVYKEILDEVYVQLDSYVAEYLEMAKTMVEEYKGVYGEQINTILASANLPYTVDNVDELFDAVETVYAYLSLKLGFTTAHEMKTDIIVPTRNDIKAVLALIMDSTENNGITTYTLDAQPMLDFIDATIEFYKEHAEDTIAEFIYFAIKDAALEYDASLTDFNAIVDYIANKFPGTYKVADAVNDYATFAESTGFLTLDQLYEALDTVANLYGIQDFSASAIVEEYSEMTLNQLAQGMTGDEEATMSDIYAMLKEAAASMVLGELDYEGMTVNDVIAQAEAYLEMLNIELNLSISLDRDGQLVAIELSQATSADYEGETMEINDIKLSIKRDDTTTVEIPAALKNAMADVTTSYDANGNLVIEGLNPDVKYDFEIYGTGKVNFSEALVKDEELSKVYGKDIYVLKEKYWNDSNHIDSYFVIDGKYYSDDTYSGWCQIIQPVDTFTLEEFKASLVSRLEDIKWSMGNIIGTDIEVYSFRLTENSSEIGIAYKEKDNWIIATRYGYADDNDTESGYYAVNPMKVEDFVKTLKVTMTSETNNDYYYYNSDRYLVSYNGQTYNRVYATVGFGNNGETTTVPAFQIGATTLFYEDYRYINSANFYNLADEIKELPEYDYSSKYNSTIARYGTDGKIEFVTVTRMSIYKKVPTYYIKVADGLYTEFGTMNGYSNSNFITSLDTTGMPELKLPDGNTLYILGETGNNKYGYKYDYNTVYGYAKVASGVYMQAAALVDNTEKIVDVLYRYASEYADISDISAVYSLDDYLTEKNGVYTVSAELISKLKALCTVERTNYWIQIEGAGNINGAEIEYMYMVGSYINMPEIDLDDIQSVSEDNYSFWRDIFGYGSSSSDSDGYDVIQNDDGSITLVFPLGTDITNISFPSNTYFPAEDLWVKNEELSASTGLNIYTCTRSYTSYHSTNTYVFKTDKNGIGKFYEWSTTSDYSQTYTTEIDDMVKNWRINGTYWRFNMVGAEGLPENLPVYETEIYYTYKYYYDHDSYWYTSNSCMTLYTFFIDGVMNVAVGAEVTGESLLTFETYMPLDDYMQSLKAELDDYTWNYYTMYINGVSTTIYRGDIYLYEIYEGEKTPKVSIPVWFVKDGSTNKFVTSRALNSTVIKLGSVADVDTEGKERNQYTSSYSNGTVTMVYYSWQETTFENVNFIELAGRMYRYDNSYRYYWWDNVYTSARLNEWQFNYQALDKVWYYVVEDLKTGERTYYTEFIPSDYGFAPAGDIVNEWDIVGEWNNEVLLGYTADGNPLYEISYYVDASDSIEWTEETQKDGTVFLHKNGIGYLKVTENSGTYYVRARKVQTADGNEEIYCFLRSGHLFGTEIGNFIGDAIDGYITVNGNTVTFTKEFLEVAKNNDRNEFYFYIQGENAYGNYRSYYFDYYQLESLFMLGNAGGVNMGGNINIGNIGNYDGPIFIVGGDTGNTGNKGDYVEPPVIEVEIEK